MEQEPITGGKIGWYILAGQLCLHEMPLMGT